VVDRDAVVEISKELESSMCWRKKQFLRKKQRKEAGDAREVIEVTLSNLLLASACSISCV
jgi:hypothetical protein